MPKEVHNMKGWGRTLGGWEGDNDDPKTLEEAQLAAMMACADRLYGIAVALEDIKMRLARMEIWFEDNVNGYGANRPTPALPYFRRTGGS